MVNANLILIDSIRFTTLSFWHQVETGFNCLQNNISLSPPLFFQTFLDLLQEGNCYPSLEAVCFLFDLFSSVLNTGLSSRLKFLLMYVLGRLLRFTGDSGKILPDIYWRYPSLGLLYFLVIMLTILKYWWKCPIPFSRNHSGSSRRNKRKHSYSYPCKTHTCQFSTTLNVHEKSLLIFTVMSWAECDVLSFVHK